MRKPKIAAYILALSLTLWAAHPVVLADEPDWLTPETVPESGEAAPEPGEGPSAEQSGWLTGTEADAQPTVDEEPASDWLTPGEASTEDTAPQSAEEDGWLTSMDVAEKETAASEEGWLTPDEAVEKTEEAAPSAKDDGWLTPDEAIEKEEEVPPPAREEGWLTPPDEAPAEEEKAPSPSEPEAKDEAQKPEEPQTPDEPQKEEEPPVLMEVEEEKFWLTPNDQPEDAAKETRAVEETPEDGALIDVTVPKSGHVAINPRHQPMRVNGETVRDQIVNEGQILTNRSNVPIVVNASVTAETRGIGAWTITGEPIQKEETAKQAYLYIEFQNLANEDSTAEWSGGYTGAANQLLVSDSGTVSGDVLRLEPGDEMPVYAAYRLFGSLTESPEDAWTDGDGLSVTISFTFHPAEDAEPEAEAGEPVPEVQVKPEEVPAAEQEPEQEQAAESAPVSEPETEPEQDSVSEPAALPPDEPEPEGAPSGTDDGSEADPQPEGPENENAGESTAQA